MNPVETECNRFGLCGEPTAIPRVNAPIREGSMTEGSECRAREDIPEIGCREGLEAAAPSTVKESPRRPCSGWRREKCWADGWPARVPYTAGEKQLCLLTCGSPAASGRAAKGERRTRPPTASPSENEGELDLHTKPRRVVVTDLSEESAFGAGRKRFRGLASPRNGETTLLIPTRRSGTTRVSRSGRLVGPLHVNPLAWLLAGRRPAAGSPNRSGGKARGLGSAARGLLPGGRLLPIAVCLVAL